MSSVVPRHQRPTNLKKFLFGCPYYPEHWTPADRELDPQRMAAAGVNIVRMGEFAWDYMEPAPGKFRFDLFDQTIERLGKVGIDTMFCTPTATPPRWLTAAHPEFLRIDEQGKRMEHGSRQHCCTTNAGFRAESRRISAELARHFAGNKHVIGWQTDNELHCHFSQCYCPQCLKGFQEFCRNKFGTIDALNAAWGTAFWALTYSDFDQLLLPYPSARPALPNPSHELDYYRFVRDNVREFQRQQVVELRKARSDWFVTHNGIMGHVDYFKFTEDLDFLGLDMYPAGDRKPIEMADNAIGMQRCRAASGGFIIPEQQAGPGGQRNYWETTPAPGQMRLWAYQSIANGADGVLHFRWRTCRFGAEEYWCGVLDHDNIPRRRYDEFSREGNELKAIGGRILHSVQDVQIGLLKEEDNEGAHVTMSLSLPAPHDVLRCAWRSLWAQHMPAGFVDTADDFAGLKMILVPSMPLMDEVLAGKLTRFVEDGGVLLVTARTATRNRNNQVFSVTPPGLLTDLLGSQVEESGKIAPATLKIDVSSRGSVPNGACYEILSLHGAQALGRWDVPAEVAPHAAAHQVAISANRVGKGLAIYVGTHITEQNAKAILDIALAEAKVQALGQGPEAVEMTRRVKGNQRLLFVLNHYPKPQTVHVAPGIDMITGGVCQGTLEMEPYGVAIIEEHDV